MTNEEYKKLSIKEFTKAAGIYEGDKAGIYEMCKKDYPDIMAELEREPFVDLLDAGCGRSGANDLTVVRKISGAALYGSGSNTGNDRASAKEEYSQCYICRG